MSGSFENVSSQVIGVYQPVKIIQEEFTAGASTSVHTVTVTSGLGQFIALVSDGDDTLTGFELIADGSTVALSNEFDVSGSTYYARWSNGFDTSSTDYCDTIYPPGVPVNFYFRRTLELRRLTSSTTAINFLLIYAEMKVL